MGNLLHHNITPPAEGKEPVLSCVTGQKDTCISWRTRQGLRKFEFHDTMSLSVVDAGLGKDTRALRATSRGTVRVWR